MNDLGKIKTVFDEKGKLKIPDDVENLFRLVSKFSCYSDLKQKDNCTKLKQVMLWITIKTSVLFSNRFKHGAKTLTVDSRSKRNSFRESDSYFEINWFRVS